MTEELVDTNTVDYLDEDPELRGQKYVCLSFLSPEQVIQDKNVFFFQKFVKAIANDITQLYENLGKKFEGDQDVQNMLAALRDRYEYVTSDGVAMFEEYKTFLRQYEEDLDRDYAKEHNFQTSVRGIKVRGSYETLPEAQNRAKQLQKFDKKFNVYVAQVGCWCPWDPNPDALESEFADTKLNTLMKKYNENQSAKDALYEQRKEKMTSTSTVTVTELQEELSLAPAHPMGV